MSVPSEWSNESLGCQNIIIDINDHVFEAKKSFHLLSKSKNSHGRINVMTSNQVFWNHFLIKSLKGPTNIFELRAGQNVLRLLSAGDPATLTPPPRPKSCNSTPPLRPKKNPKISSAYGVKKFSRRLRRREITPIYPKFLLFIAVLSDDFSKKKHENFF